jgi:hypothetical protein
MKDGYKLIGQVTELFKLEVTEDAVFGLLYPTDSVFSYGRPALYVYANAKGDSSGIAFFACIHSIDDSGCSIYGPVEEIEKAKKRLAAFAEFLKGLEYACPTKAQLREFCKNNYLQENYW